ncbi:CS1 type fimbrial major subunit [Yersinia mollaretii]|uniref:CS1 type fimbrial major subunit n=1 Tax=Yersinia mollaretii TaxID=33060 RepID=UPI0011A1FA70|nr:CS1 type fimbrial major subunit [Yersinia mollaretii]
MMKKTLLSIITMLILASSSAFAAHSVQKDISVEAEIAESIIMTKADGSSFNYLELGYQPPQPVSNNPASAFQRPRLSGSQPIKIISSQGEKVRMSLVEKLEMSKTKGGTEIFHPYVYINNLMLGTNRWVGFTLSNKELTAVLKVARAVPSDAKPGDKYTGVLKLVMEPDA